MNTENTSIIKTLRARAANHIATRGIGPLIKQSIELILGGLIGALAVAPDVILNFLAEALKTQNYAIPKAIMVMALFFCRKSILRMFKTSVKVVKQIEAKKNAEKLIDNIPVSELVDYLVRNKKFKREGVNGVRATFGLNMEKFNKLANKLEVNGVLERGENNGRQLSPKWSRQSLIDYLSGVRKSDNLLPRFKIYQIGSGGKVRLDRNEIVA